MSHRRPWRWRRLAPAVLAVGLLVAGCGGAPSASSSLRGTNIDVYGVTATSSDDIYVLGDVPAGHGDGRAIFGASHDGGRTWDLTKLFGLVPWNLFTDRAGDVWITAAPQGSTSEGLLIEVSGRGLPHPVTRLTFALGRTVPALVFAAGGLAILSTGSAVYVSRNQGRQWTSTPVSHVHEVGAETFVTPVRGWALSPAGAWKTSDGGSTWTLARGVPNLDAHRQSVWPGTILTRGTDVAWFLFGAQSATDGQVDFPVLATTNDGASFTALQPLPGGKDMRRPTSNIGLLLGPRGGTADLPASNGLWFVNLPRTDWTRLGRASFGQGDDVLSHPSLTGPWWGVLETSGPTGSHTFLAKSSDGVHWTKVPVDLPPTPSTHNAQAG